MTRPPATTAGFVVSVRGRRVYLVDTEQGRDPGMSHHEAKELAQRLLHAAAAAERRQRQDVEDAEARRLAQQRPGVLAVMDDVVDGDGPE
jgi:hypothetical protein